MKKRKVEVLDYNTKWKEKYKKEKLKIQKIFKDNLVNIYHIGSTAIKGIKAKPVIDILGVVKDLKIVDNLTYRLEALGYISKGEFGIEKRRFFLKGKYNRTHHIHFFEKGNKEIQRHIIFRDYMNAHPEKAKKYSELKDKLAKKYPENIDKYIEGKNDFIKMIDKKAKKWKDSL
ncbi:MAG: GrpB family protein [Bacillota bacterium]